MLTKALEPAAKKTAMRAITRMIEIRLMECWNGICVMRDLVYRFVSFVQWECEPNAGSRICVKEEP